MIIGSLKSNSTFSDWLLSESVQPKEVSFGFNFPDFNDSEIKESQGVLASCFIIDKRIYFVQLSKETNEIGFATGKVPKTYNEFSDMIFDAKPVKNSNGLEVFGKVFFVLLKLIKNSKVNNFYFTADSNELERIYKALTKNKFFNAELNKLGFSSLEYKNHKFISYKV